MAGQSPGGGATLTPGIEGTIEGGSTGTVTGSLKTSPSKRIRGNIGSIDLGCDPLTGTCTVVGSWLDYYFNSGYVFSYNWWGWIYHGGNNGSWVNATTGNSGDITP